MMTVGHTLNILASKLYGNQREADSQGSQLSDLNEDLAAQESTSTDSKYHVRYSEHMGLEWSVAGTNEWGQ